MMKKGLIFAATAFACTFSANLAFASQDDQATDEVIDPLEGAILAIDFENVRVPELPDVFCTKEERDRQKRLLEEREKRAYANTQDAGLLRYALETEIPALEKEREQVRRNADKAAKKDERDTLQRYIRQIRAYDEALIKVRANLGQAEAELIHFEVTQERIEKALQRLPLIPVVDCSKPGKTAYTAPSPLRLDTLKTARRSASGRAGATVIQKTISPNVGYNDFDGSEAETALNGTIREIEAPAQKDYALETNIIQMSQRITPLSKTPEQQPKTFSASFGSETIRNAPVSTNGQMTMLPPPPLVINKY